MLQADEETTLEEKQTSNSGTSKKGRGTTNSKKKMSYGELINLLASTQNKDV